MTAELTQKQCMEIFERALTDGTIAPDAVLAPKLTDIYAWINLGYRAGGELHQQLLFQVARKYPGETRHETALRYIREREQLSSDVARAEVPRSSPVVPYPPFCLHPEKCAGLAYCPRDPCCCD